MLSIRIQPANYPRILGFILISLLVMLISSCSNSDPFGSSSGVYLVRVVNSRTVSITVTIGPANYGTIAPNDTTNYQEVNEGENEIRLNGEAFQGSPAEFGTGPGTCRWTYEFGTDKFGFGLDDCDF